MCSTLQKHSMGVVYMFTGECGGPGQTETDGLVFPKLRQETQQ